MDNYLNKEIKNEGIKIEKLNFSYNDNKKILDNISVFFPKNKYISVIGHNGSGKSTLSRILSGILKSDSGYVKIDSNIIAEKTLSKIRKQISVVFQNPDNQFVGSSVYDDIKFGLRNLNIPYEKIDKKIRKVAKKLKIESLLKCEPHELSGGQKQIVALASVFVLETDYIIFDEVTSMLDTQNKKKVKNWMRIFVDKYKKTVISITHDMNEVAQADLVCVLNNGKVEYFCSPEKLFTKHENEIKKMKLDVSTAYEISKNVDGVKNTIFIKDLIKELKTKFNSTNFKGNVIKLFKNKKINSANLIKTESNKLKRRGKELIKFNDIEYSYNFKSIFEHNVLSECNGSILKYQINAIIGSMGCGKTSLVQHFNGLLFAQKGKININWNSKEKLVIRKKKLYLNSAKKKVNFRILRKNIGLVFQFAEYQFFNSTVEKEIIFGPMNFKINKNLILSKVEYYLKLVGLTNEQRLYSPFELSGGQKRRVAIASILSYEPKLLIFDEPTSGLDPDGTKKIISIINDLKDNKKTVILISHMIDYIYEIADNILFMKNGKIYCYGTPKEVFFKLHKKNESFQFPFVLDFLNKINLLEHIIKHNIVIRNIADLIKLLNIIINE